MFENHRKTLRVKLAVKQWYQTQIQTMSDDKLQIITEDPKTLAAYKKPKPKPGPKPFLKPETPEELSANAYATKKTVAQTLLDVALLTRSTKMLKTYIQHYQPDKQALCITVVVLCSIAMLLQIASAILFFFIGKWNWDKEPNRAEMNKMNNASLLLVFLIVILEVIISVIDDTENIIPKK